MVRSRYLPFGQRRLNGRSSSLSTQRGARAVGMALEAARFTMTDRIISQSRLLSQRRSAQGRRSCQRRRFLPGVPTACGCRERGGIVFFAAVLVPARRARFRRVGEIAVCSGTLWADKWDEK